MPLYTEMYRSGHNGADSKFYGCLVVSSAGKTLNIRVFKIKNRIFFSVLSCFSLQKFFDRNLSEEKSGLKYTRRVIEVVITGLTRNQLYLTVPWVRIPHSPPPKKPVIKPIAGFFLMSFSKNKWSEHTAFFALLNLVFAILPSAPKITAFGQGKPCFHRLC